MNKVSQELKGFLVLLHFPEKADPPWGLDVIDLRRPKEEIMAGIKNLIDEARDHHEACPRNPKRPPIGGPKTERVRLLESV